MTKQDFIRYLSHPESLNGHSMDELKKLVQEYPYFQMGRLLYLKNLHNENSIDYEKTLHITSAYAPSGKVLYNLIKKQVLVLNEEVGSKQLEVDNKNQKLTSNIQHPTLNEILPKKALMADKEENKDTCNEPQTLEKEMIHEAYRTSLTIDLLKEKDALASISMTAKEKPETQNQKLGTYSFDDWLKIVSGKKPESSQEDPSTSLKVTRKVKTHIIDNYILEETSKSAPKPKIEFYSAEIMAKKSIQDDETFITETLARIYLKQGNLPKALRAYEILLVKHPEKIHIFAPLLEKIKKLLKEQKGK